MIMITVMARIFVKVRFNCTCHHTVCMTLTPSIMNVISSVYDVLVLTGVEKQRILHFGLELQ